MNHEAFSLTNTAFLEFLLHELESFSSRTSLQEAGGGARGAVHPRSARCLQRLQ